MLTERRGRLDATIGEVLSSRDRLFELTTGSGLLTGLAGAEADFGCCSGLAVRGECEAAGVVGADLLTSRLKVFLQRKVNT